MSVSAIDGAGGPGVTSQSTPGPPSVEDTHFFFFFFFFLWSAAPHCLIGLVVKASASRAEGPGFESRIRRGFFGVESYQ